MICGVGRSEILGDIGGKRGRSSTLPRIVGSIAGGLEKGMVGVCSLEDKHCDDFRVTWLGGDIGSLSVAVCCRGQTARVLGLYGVERCISNRSTSSSDGVKRGTIDLQALDTSPPNVGEDGAEGGENFSTTSVHRWNNGSGT